MVSLGHAAPSSQLPLQALYSRRPLKKHVRCPYFFFIFIPSNDLEIGRLGCWRSGRLLESTKPSAVRAQPEALFRRVMATGISAPPTCSDLDSECLSASECCGVPKAVWPATSPPGPCRPRLRCPTPALGAPCRAWG